MGQPEIPEKANREQIRHIGVVDEPLVVHRFDYGLTPGAETVSDDVAIRLSLEAMLNQ